MTTDLKIAEQAEYVELSNALTGISLRRKLKSGEGPIDGLRLASGGWIGGSRLKTTQPVTDYSVAVTARGPVFAEAVCRAKLGARRSWEMKVRIQANEPIVLVEELFSTADDSAFLLSLGADYLPDRMVYRAGNNTVGANSTWNIIADAKEPLFVLEPWLHWEHAMDEPVAYYIATKDAELGIHLTAEALRMIQAEVDRFLRQDGDSAGFLFARSRLQRESEHDLDGLRVSGADRGSNPLSPASHRVDGRRHE